MQTKMMYNLLRHRCDLGRQLGQNDAISRPKNVRSSSLQVTNGFEAAYNYARDSKALPASDEAATELVQSQLLVRWAYYFLFFLGFTAVFALLF